jgi:hypothetical protein
MVVNGKSLVLDQTDGDNLCLSTRFDRPLWVGYVDSVAARSAKLALCFIEGKLGEKNLTHLVQFCG